MKLIDQVGKIFGKLTVISYAGNEHWNCKCSCGAECLGKTQRLLSGRHTSCGSIRCKLKTDIVGQRFGRLIVFDDFKYEKKSGKWNRSYVKVKCDCGIEKYVMTVGLLGGDITSCGCYKREMQEEKIFRPRRIAQGLDPNIAMSCRIDLLRSKSNGNKFLQPFLKFRDGNKCGLCNCGKSIGNNLYMHHIIPMYANLLEHDDPNNLITLCKNCHYKAHNDGKYGTINIEIQKQLQQIVSVLPSIKLYIE